MTIPVSISAGKALPVGAPSTRRSGVALIIVLGMIALLMILGVAFTITMRTERMTATFYVHQLRGEHLAHTAVARAMQDLDLNLANRVYPDWGTNAVGQRWVVTGSAGTDTNALPCTDLLVDAASAYVPAILLSQASNLVNDGGARWIAAPDGLGQYAYLIINASGLLDANQVGGGTRQYGTNAAEIAIANLPETRDAAAYLARRTNRYETLPEVWHANRVGQGGSGGLRTVLQTMSIRPPVPIGISDGVGGYQARRQDGSLLTQVPIGGLSWAELVAQRAAIVAAFEAAGISADFFPGSDKKFSEIAFYNLVDYVDGDHLPGNLGGPEPVFTVPSVEANPMFNEVLIQYTINITNNAGGGWSYTSTRRIDFELAWLFPPELFSGPYHFNYRVEFDDTVPVSGISVPSPVVQYDRTYNTSPRFGMIPESPAAGPSGNLAAFPETFTINAHVTTWTTRGGSVVDTNQTLTVSLPFEFSDPAGESQTVTRGLQCIEPRLNYFPTVGQVANWVPTGPGPVFPPNQQPSIGATNSILQSWFVEPQGRGSDGIATFFVANRPVRTLGELGYLFYGSPWRTIRLYQHIDAAARPIAGAPIHRVLDHFTLTPDAWRYGLINPNTDTRGILAVALTSMPYGGSADAMTPALTLDQAVEINDAWMLDVRYQGAITNLSEIGRLTNVFYGNTVFRNSSEPEREALIRNAAGLFHPRQNQFIIVVAVNTFGVGGQEIGMRRLVAEVWRDPFKDAPGGGGKNRSYLRFFQWVY